MSLSQQPASLSSRLTALAQRLGLIGRGQRQILERASQLRLPFAALPPPHDSICWLEGAQLQRLVDLPRDALSGPVQEDKAQARATLMGVVELEKHALESLDLRQIDGLCVCDPQHASLASFEQYAASAPCRPVRIISYKDFIKTISLALPRFLAGERISLRQAAWRGQRLFWAGEQHGEAFACAIAYARRRGLEITLPADLSRYRLSHEGLAQLQRHYHVQAMPGAAWSDPTFMGLLLDKGLPYARLSLLCSPGAAEFLLLPKHSAEARALGEGLRLAGAPDVVAYLKALAGSATTSQADPE
ncbi:hypothetical protein I0D00_03450 [Pseudomonas lalucatii]|uniref:Uncharacterized protein n=1 Tax=Pseudomonas lalucatii TaxID=1424203 RepID=A0ABS5PY44_9PSED|nr:DUF6685 family protein [Pseudomonas lalucatii]MBS7661008.1 hypothetical protein [Pseudomonas lalucatii]